MDPLTMAGVGMGIIQSGIGIVKSLKADAMASRNIRPKRTKAKGITDNLALSESLAGQGLTDGAKQAYMTGAERGLTNSLEAVLRSGTGGNAIVELQDQFEQNTSRMALAEDEARLRNMSIYMKNNLIDANEDDLNWQVNEYAPWADRQQQIAQMKADATQNISGGINTAFSAVASAQQGGNNPSAGVPRPTVANGGSTNTAPYARYTTTNLSPNPRTISYTPRSLQTMNELGLRPLSTGTVRDPITGLTNPLNP